MPALLPSRPVDPQVHVQRVGHHALRDGRRHADDDVAELRRFEGFQKPNERTLFSNNSHRSCGVAANSSAHGFFGVVEFALRALQYRGRLIPVMVKPTSDIPWILKKFPTVRLNQGMAEAAREVADYVEHGFELTPAKP